MSSNEVTQQALGKHVGVSHTSISNWKKGEQYPDVRALVKICKYFGIDPTDLIFKDLTTGIEPSKLQNIALPGNISGSNLLIPESTQADYNKEWGQEYIQKLSYVNIPGIEGEARTFEVTGNSMSPVLESGDYVACVACALASVVETSKIYAIVSDQIRISYLRPEHNRVLCIPANREEFEPYHINTQDIREVWEARVRLTAQITDPRLLAGSMERKMKTIEAFFKDKFPEIILE